MDRAEFILVSVKDQTLTLWKQHTILCHYSVSTSKFGVGEEYGSYKTPRGWHIIRAKIGENCPYNTVFERRRPTGEIYSPELSLARPNKNWIMTRILWLSGLERGKNRFGKCDTMRRYIYIHGVPDTVPMGLPDSHGCVNMRNEDIIRLFDLAPVGTPLLIQAE